MKSKALGGEALLNSAFFYCSSLNSKLNNHYICTSKSSATLKLKPPEAKANAVPTSWQLDLLFLGQSAQLKQNLCKRIMMFNRGSIHST